MRAVLTTTFAVYALVTVALVPAAEAATYQKSVVMNCAPSNTCTATFPAVPAGKVLRINHVSCAVSATAQIFLGYSALGISPMTNFDDGTAKHFLTWNYTPGGNTGAITSAEVPYEVKAGKQPQILTVVYFGTRSGSCNISGNMVKL